MARVALRTLFGTAYPAAAGISRIFREFFWDIRNEFQDFKMEKAPILDDNSFLRKFQILFSI